MPIVTSPTELFDGGETANLQTTVCVIGSGFSGAIVAVELARAGIDVVLLESGTNEPDHRLDAMLDEVNVSGSTQLNFGFAHQFGGASNLWAGRVAPFESIDFERREWVAHSGWPLSKRELEPYYGRVGELLGIPGYDGFRGHGDAKPAFLSSGKVEIKSFQWAGKPFNSRHYVTDAAQKLKSLRVVMNAPVVELAENESTRAVDAAKIALPDGRTARVCAKLFVVAAGGIQTPRLLLNSTAVRASGIGGDHDVVGRYFATHPKADMATLVVKKPVSTRHALYTDQRVASGRMRYGLGFNAATQKESRLLNHYVQVHAFPEHRANKLFEKLKGSDAFNSPLIDRSPLISGFLPGLGKIVFDKMGRLGGIQRRARKFILRAILDQYPNPENRITLSKNQDKNGMRKANVNWRFSEDDRASVIEFFDLLKGEMRTSDVKRFQYDRLRSIEDWPLTGIHSHFMGATRMGDNLATSVTTKDCRIHGSDNVFVVGPSLFPTYGYANPVYTIAALSLRLADHLKTRPNARR